jgi:non-specific serine/threonine protein kinase/serine/threonine-protein kinase
MNLVPQPPGDGIRTGPFTPTAETTGTVIAGRYQLLQQLGEGGFGLVYMAEQRAPVQRTVAVKLIKPGMDSAQVLARFEAERQALALMDHPNIAKVLDGGTTEQGQPFFVMELVRGIPITSFCDEHRLTLRQRLELLVPVCQAVQHAHQKGVIHRDLKPSNVLVTSQDGRPVPKVIDFGIAKALHQRLTERTMFTEIGQVVGTPEYMAPEQAGVNLLDIDTRSDIYGLGVLLYELLTGVTPLNRERLRQGAYDEVLRLIREVEPARPSTRITTVEELPSVAARRQVEPWQLGKLLRGELDWIVMKCLEKDRSRRYETANGLARDIQRYLADEPVEACPPSAGYKVRKFVGKNKRVFVTAAAFAVLLVAGAVASMAQAIRATRAEDLAQRRLEEEAKARAEAEAVRDFFVEDMIGWVAPEKKMGRQVTVDQVLDGAERAIGTRFLGQPLTEAAVRLTLGRVYRDLGQYDKAEGHLRWAQGQYTEHLGSRHRRTLETRTILGNALWQMGRIDEAARVLEEAVEFGRQALGPEDTQTLWSLQYLAYVRGDQGSLKEAELMQRQVLEARRRLQGEDDPATIMAKNDLAVQYFERGEMEQARRLTEEAAQASSRVQGPNHPATLLFEVNLAETLGIQGQEVEAIRLLDQLLERCRRVCGPDYYITRGTEATLASFLAIRPDPSPGDLARALELSKKSTDTPNMLHAMAALAWNTTGIVHYRRGDWKAALQALGTAEGMVHGYYKWRNDFFLAMTHQRLGNKDKARQCYDRAADWMDKNQRRAPELLRLRAEAASALGIKAEPMSGAR